MPEEDPVLRGAGQEEVVVEGVPGDLVHWGHVGGEGAEELSGELHRAQLDVTFLEITNILCRELREIREPMEQPKYLNQEDQDGGLYHQRDRQKLPLLEILMEPKKICFNCDNKSSGTTDDFAPKYFCPVLFVSPLSQPGRCSRHLA